MVTDVYGVFGVPVFLVPVFLVPVLSVTMNRLLV